MQIDISHEKNPAVGWDIDVKISAADNEKIAYVKIEVNGFPEVRDSLDPPLNNYHRRLSQQGQYPGHNTVLVTATDASGNETRASDEWDY